MAPRRIIPPKEISSIADDEWRLISPIIERRSAKGGRPPANSRLSLEGMRWVASTYKPWADMPPEYGNWASVKRYYARLKKRGVIAQLLKDFPKNAGADEAETRSRILAQGQLACLQNLTERRPRGRAAGASPRSV